MIKSAPKVPKVWTSEKVHQKFQNYWGGVRLALEETEIKAAFLFREAPLIRKLFPPFFVSVLLSAHAERFSIFRVWDFFIFQ